MDFAVGRSVFVAAKDFWQRLGLNLHQPLVRVVSTWTTILLVGACAYLTHVSVAQDRISCHPIEYGLVDPSTEVKYLNSFCYWKGNFTPYYNPKEGHKLRAVYRWTHFYVFAMVVVSLFPGLIWNEFDGGSLKLTILKIQEIVNIRDTRSTTWKQIRDVVLGVERERTLWTSVHILVEILHFAAVFANLALICYFFGISATDLPKIVDELLFVEQVAIPDVLIPVFPPVIKCELLVFSSAGELLRMETFFILGVNIHNSTIITSVVAWYLSFCHGNFPVPSNL